MPTDKLPKSSRSVSIYDVAEAAGVSYATVSRALNNRQDVNPETRRRILEIAEKLNYVPNPIARGLSTKSTAAFGVIVPGIADPFFMPIAQGLEQTARQIGYRTLLHNTDRSASATLEGATMVSQFRVAGVVILGGSQLLDDELARQLDGIPTVVVLRPTQDDVFPAIYFDHASGARKVVSHLVSLQRKRIAFVSGDEDSVAADERQRGYQEALESSDLSVDPDLLSRGEFTIEGSIAATTRLLELPASKRPDALFYASDAMALAGLSCLHRAKIRVPEDIAVAGFGNIAFSAISEPPLTTVNVPKEQLGIHAVQMLVEMIENPSRRPADVVADIDLIVRESTRSSDRD